MTDETPPTPFPLNPIYNPNDWISNNAGTMNIAYLDANYLKFNTAQGTENFNTLSANEITAPGDLFLNPVGSVDMNGKVLNMTNGEIHNCPLVHSKNNEDIIIEGKGTGKVILKTNNSDAVRIFSDKSIFYKPLNMNFDTNIISYKIFIQNTGVGAQTTLLQTEDLRFRIENNSNGGVIDLITSASTFPFAKTTVLEASSTSVIIRKPLDMSNNSITGCTLFQSPANSNIRIDAQGSGSDITLRANLLDTLKIGPVGVQPYKPIFMSATDFPDRSIYSGALFLQNNVNGGAVGRLSMDASLVLVENRANLGNIIFQTRDAISATVNVLEVSSGAVIMKRPITLNDASSDNRGINSSVFNFNEVVGGYNPTVLYQIYQTGVAANHINYVNSGRFNFSVINAGSTLVTPLQITSTSNNIASNINLVMAAGTGIINQPYTTDSPIANNFKKTNIVVNSGSATGSSTSALEIYDDFNSIGKGLFILPNSGSGSLSTLNLANDCALVSRSPQNNNAISITNWNSDMKNGIRIFTTDVSNCGMTLQCGSGSAFSELRMAFNRTLNTFTTTFNNPIDFNPGTILPARRLLSGLGTLSFTDILGNTTGGTDTGTIFNNSLATVPGMQYISNLNTGSHNFIVSDASFKYNPFSVNFQNIRHNVPTVLADFDNGNSLTVAGGLITASISVVNVASSTSPRTLGSYTIVSRGTYMVVANFKLVTVGSNATVNKFMCGTVNVALTFNTAGQYSTGTVNVDNTVAYIHPAIYQTVSTQMITISNPNSPIYFTYIIDFLGPATQMGISMTYSITRIA